MYNLDDIIIVGVIGLLIPDICMWGVGWGVIILYTRYFINVGAALLEYRILG